MRVWGVGVGDFVEVEESGAGDVAGCEDLAAGALLRIIGEEPGAADGNGFGRGGELGGRVGAQGGG